MKQLLLEHYSRKWEDHSKMKGITLHHTAMLEYYQEVFCFPPTASLSLFLEPESKHSIYCMCLESHRALVMEHDSVVLYKTNIHVP